MSHRGYLSLTEIYIQSCIFEGSISAQYLKRVLLHEHKKCFYLNSFLLYVAPTHIKRISKHRNSSPSSSSSSSTKQTITQSMSHLKETLDIQSFIHSFFNKLKSKTQLARPVHFCTKCMPTYT